MLCKEDVHIYHTNFAKKMEQNLHETTIWWKTYGKQLFSKDLEVQDDFLFIAVDQGSTHWHIMKDLPIWIILREAGSSRVTRYDNRWHGRGQDLQI
jgi:hypothetical protein